MTISASRTVVVRAQPSGYGVAGAPLLVWPTAQPDDLLDYALDATAPLADVADSIVSASLAIMPSGTGELQASALSVAGPLVTLWLGGGVAGRTYLVRLDVKTVGRRTFSWIVRLPVSADLAAIPPPPAAVPGFGTAMLWPVIRLTAVRSGALVALRSGALLELR